jgi:hypothetical protein
MRKLSVLAMIMAVLVAGSAFAAGRLTKQADATFTPGVITSGGIAAGIGPTTTNNDDSCDIGVAPAASLLLPYFEVDLGTAGTGRTTIFSITNVSPYAQIAHVVLYTDWSFPVLDFNLYLTGYDVQPINLYDVIARGTIGSATGTSTAAPNAFSSATSINNVINSAAAGTGSNPNTGTQPFRVTTLQGNPNFLPSASTNCAPGRLPGQLPTALATDVKALLSTGRSTGAGITCPGPGGEQQVGGNHGGNVAIGYATIDVAATCSVALPVDATYFTGEILFDNVLIGDYQDINQSTTSGNYAGGNPLVHIRAVPEGGPAGGAAIATNLPFTFYDRYQTGAGAARTVDRRQPLPSAFAARWISGSTAAFDTQYKIWREGYTTGTAGGFAGCTDYVVNSVIPLVEMVRFDERENAGIAGSGIIVSPPTTTSPTTPETSRVPVTNSLFPVVAGSTDVGGWMYMNLNNGGDATATSLYGEFPYNATRPGFGVGAGALGAFPRDVSQNWVIVSMFAQGLFGVDYDAAWLGNGCSPAFPATSGGAAGTAVNRIAPAGGVLVCPTGVTTAGGTGNLQCTGTNVTP